jgi:hypothetical protein
VQAGVVAWRGRAIVIPGDSNAGTTTLVAELVRCGATYYSDERAVIDDDGMVQPYARRRGPVRAAPSTSALPAIEPVLLVATTYEPGATWAPAVLRGAHAALPLLDHLLTARDEPQRAVRLAASVGARLVALQGPRPDASAVAPAILEFVDQTLDGIAPPAAPVDGTPPVPTPVGVDEVLRDPGWVPVAMKANRTRVRFRHYERPFYIAQAGKQPRPSDVELSRDDIEDAAAPLRDPAKAIYMYHHGYAGSTLLARLLDAPGTCLVYNEPNVHFGRYHIPALRRLCYRTFGAGETPLIKALPAEIAHAPQHFADHPQARAVFFYSPLDEYVASVLAHEYRCTYVTDMAQQFGGEPCTDPASAAVRCWEHITAEAIRLGATLPMKTVESNAFFSDPVRHLVAIWGWFGFPPRADWDDTIARVASSHSKSSEPFGFADRLTQRDAYADGARSWLSEHGSLLEGARLTMESLARLNL